MSIRDERPGDRTAIAEVVTQAFGRDDEARLVERLRQAGDATISLVTEVDGAIVGHVLFSPMTAPFRALGLAPVSVLPAHQRRGIGAELIKAGIAQARDDGWHAVFVLGDPAYYQRFGFRADLAAGFVSPYAGPHLMVLPIIGALPASNGRIDYARAFGELA